MTLTVKNIITLLRDNGHISDKEAASIAIQLVESMCDQEYMFMVENRIKEICDVERSPV